MRYLTELLDRKRVEPGEDLVTDLVRAGDEHDALNQQEMLSTIFQLMVAGHDTTTSLIGNGTVALLRHPDQRAALAADPGLLPRAIEEILRWDAPSRTHVPLTTQTSHSAESSFRRTRR